MKQTLEKQKKKFVIIDGSYDEHINRARGLIMERTGKNVTTAKAVERLLDYGLKALQGERAEHHASTTH